MVMNIEDHENNLNNKIFINRYHLTSLIKTVDKVVFIHTYLYVSLHPYTLRNPYSQKL